MRRKKQKRMSPRRAAALLVLLAIAMAALYQGGRWLETSRQQPEARGDHRQRYAYDNLIEVDGASYRQRKELTTILLMGIDRREDQTITNYRNGGQADFLRVLVIDPEARRISQLEIDRDTMTPITILGVLGDKSGVRTAQIALSHGFGDGGEQSCKLASEAVSNLLLGTDINLYAAMNMKGIAQMNDSLGGVTVTLRDDFTYADAAMVPGATLRLNGKQAEAFVRGRMLVGSGTNAERMQRQNEYLSQAASLLNERVRQDQQFMGALYDDLAPYLTTNLSRGRIINEAWLAKDYETTAVISIPGRHAIGADGFMQFHADEEALKQIVLNLFYEQVK